MATHRNTGGLLVGANPGMVRDFIKRWVHVCQPGTTEAKQVALAKRRATDPVHTVQVSNEHKGPRVYCLVCGQHYGCTPTTINAKTAAHFASPGGMGVNRCSGWKVDPSGHTPPEILKSLAECGVKAAQQRLKELEDKGPLTPSTTKQVSLLDSAIRPCKAPLTDARALAMLMLPHVSYAAVNNPWWRRYEQAIGAPDKYQFDRTTLAAARILRPTVYRLMRRADALTHQADLCRFLPNFAEALGATDAATKADSVVQAMGRAQELHPQGTHAGRTVDSERAAIVAAYPEYFAFLTGHGRTPTWVHAAFLADPQNAALAAKERREHPDAWKPPFTQYAEPLSLREPYFHRYWAKKGQVALADVFVWFYPADADAAVRRALRTLLADYVLARGFFDNADWWADAERLDRDAQSQDSPGRAVTPREFWLRGQDLAFAKPKEEADLICKLVSIMVRLATMKQGVSGAERSHSDRALLQCPRGPERGDQTLKDHMDVYTWHRFRERRAQRAGSRAESWSRSHMGRPHERVLPPRRPDADTSSSSSETDAEDSDAEQARKAYRDQLPCLADLPPCALPDSAVAVSEAEAMVASLRHLAELGVLKALPDDVPAAEDAVRPDGFDADPDNVRLADLASEAPGPAAKRARVA